jgi:EAL domain-containing protein (putative c-di-GMP-specific phosphodiesterase class I)
MALQQDSIWLLSISACSCAAIGIAAYGLGTGTLTVPLAAGGIMALGAGLLLSQMRDYLSGGEKADADQERQHLYHRLDRVERAGEQTQRGQDSIQQQIAGLQHESLSGTAALTRALEDIRAAHGSLAEQITSVINRPPVVQQVYVPVEPPRAAFVPEPVLAPVAPPAAPPVAEAQPEPDADDDTPFGRQLSLSLEPIVDLYSSQTAHYRLVASMLDANGVEVAPELFAHHVSQLGQRSLLDAFVIRETIGILAELRKRDSNLCVLVPIGAATLADRKYLLDILEYVAAAPDAAGGLVLDINHGVLASLPDASLEGLAILARKGVTLALSQASIGGLDLAALSKLNVRYVCLAAASLALGTKTPATVSGFIQAARALRIQTIITQVTDPQILAEIMRSARLACGPAFAAPRRLRRAAPEAAPDAFPAAA